MPEYKLTDHQQEKFNEVVSLLNAGHTRIVLQGSAGCGKTVLVSELAKKAKIDRTITPMYNNGHVFVTAPTNKALGVLQDKVSVNVDFKTIHSALKLKRFTDQKTGKHKFIPQKTWGKKVDEFIGCRLCAIDECSMLSNKFIGGHTDEKGQFHKGYLDNLRIPIIFIGDEKQLNPVKEDYSPAFHQNWPVVELTEIIRQGAGNPIIELSRDLDMIYFKTPKMIDGRGYVYDNNKAGIIDSLAEVNGTDELKYISWANDDVDEMNSLVRKLRYGNPRKIEKNETIVFNSPFGEFYTNKELKVEDLDVFVDYVKVPRFDTRFDKNEEPISATDNIKMKFYKINDKISIVHEDSENLFKIIAMNLAHLCKTRGWSWTGYYWFVEQFADIKYNHALTIHKSQGSTYKQTIVNIENVDFNKRQDERRRMLYTAVTRASNVLILNNVR